LTITVDRQIAVGDQVVSYWKAHGTHNGEALGLTPTGKTVEVEGLSLLTLKNGKLVEQIIAWDGMGMMRQIGVLPEGM
jgi:predicted ester cyclase